MAFVASAVVVVVMALSAAPIARWVVESRARERGLDATATEVSVSFSRVRVERFDAAIQSLPGARLSLRGMTISLSWFRPKEVTAQGGSVSVQGEWADLVKALSALSTPESDGRTTPTRVDDMTVTWSLPSGRQAVLISGAHLERSAEQKTVLSASAADAFGWRVGAFAVELKGKDEPVRLGLGAIELAQAPVRVEAAPLGAPDRVDATLRETDVPTLAGLLSLDGLSPPKAKLVGSLSLTRAGEVWSGTAEGALRGWAPPVPKELGGIVFGKDTTLTASVRADLSRQTGAIDRATVSLGAVKLTGGLTFDWTEHAPGKLKGALSGSVACSALAGSALAAHLGPLAGGLAGALAGSAIQGTVGISLRVDVDLARPALGKVAPQVTMGCKTVL